jgi:uncharacterized protein
MFRLMAGRHRQGAGGDQGDAVLQARMATLQSELAAWKALADRRARSINMLRIGIVGLILAFAFALAAGTAPLRQAAHELAQALGLAAPVDDIDAALAAYRKGDYAKALRHVRPPAERGDPRAQFTLGLMYLNARGVPQDDLVAATWFRRAADQDDAAAQFNLGLMYTEGRGVPQDFAEAAKWYRLAAGRGHAQAQYNLALSYARGEGVSQDFVSAHMWFNLAAAHFPVSDIRNHELAARNRSLVATKMTREQIDEAQTLAREWKPR